MIIRCIILSTLLIASSNVQAFSSTNNEAFQRALLAERLNNNNNAKVSSTVNPLDETFDDDEYCGFEYCWNDDTANSDPYSFVVPVLGDLHIDPRKMEDYETGREHIKRVITKAKQSIGEREDEGVAIVSLGDLGESKNCDHNEDNPFELFAGTTQCHELASDFLSSFDVPYEVIGGNHDLEGIDEFDTDAKNLRRFLQAHGKPTPQFCRQVAEKTLLVGLCSTIFRDAK